MILPWEATVQLSAYPFTSTLSWALAPCAFRTLIDLIGQRTSPFTLVRFTARQASTTSFEKNSESLREIYQKTGRQNFNISHYFPMSFDDIDVFATLTRQSLPKSSELTAK